MNPDEKPLFRFKGVELSTPPMGESARREAGFLLGLLQADEALAMPQSRALSGIAPGLHELRVREADKNWRIFYRADDEDRILIIHQINKTTRTLPDRDKATIRQRLASYDAAWQEEKTK